MKGLLPDNETARLESLRRYGILDTEPEPAFDDLTRLAAHVCGTPIAVINLIGEDQQWFKSAVGLAETELPREAGLCPHVILDSELLVVRDTLEDERFATNPVVISGPQIRFYAGVPLLTPDGHALGTLCVADRMPRELSPDQAESLKVLGRQVVIQLELRRHLAESAIAMRERKRAEEALKEGEERYRLIIETAKDAFVAMDTSGLITEWNRQAEVTFGWGREEVMGRPLAETIVPPQHREAHKKGLQRFLATGQGTIVFKRIELMALHREGHEFPVELTVWPIRAGETFTFNAFVHDITERKRAEEALRASEERFRQMEENIREVFWMTSPDKNHMIYISPGYEEIWGRTCASLYERPRSWLDAIHPEDRERVVGALEKQPQGEYDEEYRIVRSDGSVRWIRDRAFPIRNESGEVYRIVGIAEEITERKQMEQQLRQADKLAALGTLLSGVAHEVNNPLFVISSYAEVATEKLRQAQYEGLDGDLAEIREATQQASVIVKRFLGAARSAGGRSEPCRVDALVQRILELVANDFTIHQIAVRTIFHSDLPPVLADPHELTQVFLNLFTNARQAMAAVRGPAMLTVTTALRSHQHKSWVEIRVADNGPGIAPQHLPFIFDPFFTTKPVGKGTGLGLSICHRIVTELGGTLTCESAVGHGATFIVRLPVAPESQAASAQPPPKLYSILMVEDDPDVLEVVGDYLDARSYRVARARSGQEAIRALGQGRFDLLLLDFMMPEMNGAEVYQRACAAQPTLAERTILLTGAQTASAVQQFIRETGCVMVGKPVSLKELEHQIRDVLSR